MKKLFILSIGLMLHLNAFAQSKSVATFYESQKGKDHEVCISISGSMLSFLANIDDDDKELKKASKQISDLKILSIEKGKIDKKLITALQTSISTEGYEDYMVVREGGKLTKFLAKEKGDVITSLIVIAEGDENYTVIEFNGQIDPKALSGIGDNCDIKGLENMKKVKKK